MDNILIIGDSNWHGSWTESTILAFKKYANVEFFSYLNNSPSLANQIRDRIIQNKFIGDLYKKYYSSKKRLASYLRNKEFSSIIILKGEILELEDIKLLKKHTKKLVTWWVDDIFVYPEYLKLLPFFNHVFIFDSFYIPVLEAKGAKAVSWLPCAFNKEIYFPGEIDKGYECDVAFVGSYFPPREKLFNKFTDTKINFKIWGPGWEKAGLDNFFKIYPNAYQGTNLSNENAAKLYRSAKILLNLNHPQTKFNGINQRAFEIPACNGFQLIDSRDGFSEVFANKKDLVYFNSTDEIPGLVSYFLENETERLNIAKSGNLKVWEKHSIENRVIEILKILKD